MFKKLTIIFCLIIFSLTVFVVVFAQEDPPEPFCGDGIVQSPNATGQFEKCDDSGEVGVLLANGKVLLER